MNLGKLSSGGKANLRRAIRKTRHKWEEIRRMINNDGFYNVADCSNAIWSRESCGFCKVYYMIGVGDPGEDSLCYRCPLFTDGKPCYRWKCWEAVGAYNQYYTTSITPEYAQAVRKLAGFVLGACTRLEKKYLGD